MSARDELRTAVAEALLSRELVESTAMGRDYAYAEADAVLATPEVAALLEVRERVEALAEDWEFDGLAARAYAGRLRAALDGSGR